MEKKEVKIRIRDVQDVLELIGGRWRVVIIASLCERPKRFSELKKEIGNITSRILIKELRFLEMNLMIGVEKSTLAENSVIYFLTEHGKSFQPISIEIQKWANEHRAMIMKKL